MVWGNTTTLDHSQNAEKVTSFEGREAIAAQEENLADRTVLWVAGGPASRVLDPDPQHAGRLQRVPYMGTLRFRKLARAIGRHLPRGHTVAPSTVFWGDVCGPGCRETPTTGPTRRLEHIC
eukprot:144207-Amphidinium_carterae.2